MTEVVAVAARGRISASDLGLWHDAQIDGLRRLADFQRWQWSVMCAGGNLFAAAAAMERGGHIAIGLGDYPYPELGRPTNAGLVAHIAALARAMGREVATPDQTRQMLGLVS